MRQSHESAALSLTYKSLFDQPNLVTEVYSLRSTLRHPRPDRERLPGEPATIQPTGNLLGQCWRLDQKTDYIGIIIRDIGKHARLRVCVCDLDGVLTLESIEIKFRTQVL